MKTSPFEAIAPGRVCLFGEHSDYLGLGVISAAINLTIKVRARPIEVREIQVDYLDTGESDAFSIEEESQYKHPRDYVRGAFNVLFRRGVCPVQGWLIEVSGNIPFAAGLSSSSALTVAAVKSFAWTAGVELEGEELANTAFHAEVTEFSESGGMMDHYTSVFGNLIHLDPCGLTLLPASIIGLVVGDSLEPKKDTVGDLAAIRSSAEEGYRVLSKMIPGFNQLKTPMGQIENHIDSLSGDCRRTTLTALRNRELTREAHRLLSKPDPDLDLLGNLIDKHHTLLRDGLNRSTEKIEAMIEAAKEVGALGCKINGSGGGGTMLALAPGKEASVATAIESVGGRAYQVKMRGGCALKKAGEND
ncbi:GHMP kinase [Candidatus Thorarchaeota archaeon]|nr:MAG: GHMP kinase [Candidatus Thorarchaeota archaeon]